MAHRLRPLVRLIAALACALAAACSSSDGGGRPPPATPAVATVTMTPAPTASPSPATTAVAMPPGPPRRVAFAPGETVDVTPAVVFVDTASGATTAWVFPAAIGMFGVSPAGDSIVWSDGEQTHLFRTDDERDRVIDAHRLPIAYGPGDAGFVALTQTGDVALTAFDAYGTRLADLAPVDPRQYSAADWGTRAIGIGARADTRLLVVIATSADTPATVAVDAETPPRGGAWVRWSHAGDRLAVVTADAVRVLDLAGETIGQSSGEFFGNPQWSPDDAYLYVNAMPWSGGDVAYLFTPDGSPVFRYVSRGGTSTGAGDGFGYGCGGEVWLDATHFGFEDRVLSVDGDAAAVPATGVEPRFHSPLDFGVTVARDAGPDLITIAGGYRQFLDDGRFVFQTIGVFSSHGGCAEQVTLDPSIREGVERPPYDLAR